MSAAKNASKKDIMEFSKEMKDHWKVIEKAAAPLKKTVVKATVSVEKAVAKKAPTKKVTK